MAQRVVEHRQKRACWKTEARSSKKKAGDWVRESKAVNEGNSLSSWLRSDEEGRAKEEEDMKRRVREEEVKRERIEVEEVMERACLIFCSGFSGNPFEVGAGAGWMRDGGCEWESGSDFDVRIVLLSLFLS